MGWKFWAGIALMIGGMTLMVLPDKCVDCDDEVTDSTHIYSQPDVEVPVSEDADND